MFKGEYLKELRESAGLSRVDVAVAMNRHPNWVKNSEEGKHEPSMHEVKKLADYFNSLRWFDEHITVKDFWEEPK